VREDHTDNVMMCKGRKGGGLCCSFTAWGKGGEQSSLGVEEKDHKKDG